MLYTSGQIGLDPATGELVAGGFEAQARQVFANLAAVLAAPAARFGDVVKATVYLADMADFPTLNADLRRGVRRAQAGALDGAGRGAAQGRTRRDRPDRPQTGLEGRTGPAHQDRHDSGAGATGSSGIGSST